MWTHHQSLPIRAVVVVDVVAAVAAAKIGLVAVVVIRLVAVVRGKTGGRSPFGCDLVELPACAPSRFRLDDLIEFRRVLVEKGVHHP